MSRSAHPRRKRRPDDGRFLPKDLAAWQRLVKRARHFARAHPHGAAPLADAASTAAKAVPPPGHAHRESPFLQLIVKGRLAWPAPADRQAALAPEVGRLAEACALALERAGEGRERRSRADLGEGED